MSSGEFIFEFLFFLFVKFATQFQNSFSMFASSIDTTKHDKCITNFTLCTIELINVNTSI